MKTLAVKETRQAELSEGQGRQGRGIPEKDHSRRIPGSLSSHGAVMPPGCWGLSLLLTQSKQELDPRQCESHPCPRASRGCHRCLSGISLLSEDSARGAQPTRLCSGFVGFM